jgi:predicted nuclease of predicted toxin-antitoxin system
VFLDEGVPVSVGRVFETRGHEVIYLAEALQPGSPDPLVCAAAEANDAILVAHDGDMREHARRHGVGQRRFRRLSLIKLSCRESQAARRVDEAMALIEAEWERSQGSDDRRIFVEIKKSVILTRR